MLNNLRPNNYIFLTDILANSVAILIVLIILSFYQGKVKTAHEFEQLNDINSLLGRELVKTVVQNPIPSSKPARLHNYDGCEIPHDCNPSLFPIVSVFDWGIFINNPRNKITIQQLAQKENNILENYLARLPGQIRRNIRMDIYGIAPYYLVLSIFKEQKIQIRHWHFMKIAQADANNLINLYGPSENWEDSFKSLEYDESLGNSLNVKEEKSNSNSESEQNESSLSIPSESNLSNQSSEKLQKDILSLDDFKGYEENSNQQKGSQSKYQNGESLEQVMSNELLDVFGDTASQPSNEQSKNSTIRFRMAGSESGESEQIDINDSQKGEGVPMNYDRIKLFLYSIYEYLDKNTTTDKKNKKKINTFEELLQIMHQMNSKTQEELNQLRYSKLAENMVQQLKTRSHTNKKNQVLVNQIISDVNGKELALSNLGILEQVNLMIAKDQTQFKRLHNQYTFHTVNLILRTFQSMSKGSDIQLTPNSVLLALVDNEKSDLENKWRLAVFSDTQLTDLVFGYIYGRFQNDKLILDTEVNQVKINKTPVVVDYNKYENLFGEQYFYVFIIFFVILILVAMIAFLYLKIKTNKLTEISV